MSDIRCYKDIVAWQKAYELGKAIHALTKGFPDEEKYGITSQLRRASVSIASNIAEGYGRGTTPDYLRFLKIARGSIYEVDTQLQFSRDFEYAPPDCFQATKEILDEAERVLAGLIRAIESRRNTVTRKPSSVGPSAS